jgi:hypothetical protein
MKLVGQIRCRAAGRRAAVALTSFWFGGGLFAEAQTSASAETNAPANALTQTNAPALTNAPAQTNAPAAETKGTAPPVEFKPLEPGEYNNWLDLGLGHFLVSDDKAQFQQRNHLPSGTFGGVQDFHWETSVGKQALFTVDGRGVFDNHDYDLTLGLTQPETGYVRAGYKEFRTYYDGSGGFFPPNNQWFNIYNDELQLDRSEAWIEAGLRVPNVPEITFRYSHEVREGKKDSTIWGDTGLTGGLGTRAIVPSFYGIDEKRNIFDLDAKHTIGKTEFGVGGRVDLLEQNDSLNIRRRPDETGTTVAGPGTSIDRYVTQRNNLDADNFNVHTFADTRFNDRVRFTVGGSFTTLETDISGSRIYGPSYDSVYNPLFVSRQERDSGFLDLGGGAHWKQYVGNMNLMFTPWEHVDVVPSLRIEHAQQDGYSHYISTDVGAAPTFPSTQQNITDEQERNYTDVSQALEVRYTGITNWVFYTRGEWVEGQEDLTEHQVDTDLPPPGTKIARDTDTTRFTQKYVLGINWYPQHRLNLSLQYYHRQQENDYNQDVDSTSNATNSGDRYPGFIMREEFKTDDVNFRVTWRPFPFLTTITRYDFQRSTIDNQGDHLDSVMSGDLTSHIINEGITLVPWNPIYIQLSATYAYNEWDTQATGQPGAAANLVTPSLNGYWMVGGTLGWTLDDRTDLQAQYSYYESDDFRNNSTVSTPYGNSSHEHRVTVALNRMLTKKLRWTMKYGFFDYDDDTSGNHNSYRAHMIYSSLQFRF